MGLYRGPWELVDLFMHWGHWLAVLDTMVGKSDPALPLRRKTDCKTIKHTIKNFFPYCDCDPCRGGKAHDVLNDFTGTLAWLEGEEEQ